MPLVKIARISASIFHREQPRSTHCIYNRILPRLSDFGRFKVICLSQWKFETKMGLKMSFFCLPPPPAPHLQPERVFINANRQIEEKVEGGEGREKMGGGVCAGLFLCSQGWDCSWQKYSGGEGWLRWDQRERCAKLIWQCQLLLRGCSLCAVIWATKAEILINYTTWKEGKFCNPVNPKHRFIYSHKRWTFNKTLWKK